MTVYIDSLFLLDLVVDYLLLLLTGKVTGSPLRRWRLTAAARWGEAILSCVSSQGFPS